MTDDSPSAPVAAGGEPAPRRRSLGRNTAIMAAGTLVSRVLGLVRTALLASAIGVTGVAADAYAVANNLPNIMYAILAAGVLNAVLVPQITRAFHDGRERTVHRILTLGMTSMVLTTLVLTAMAGFWVHIYAGSWGPDQTALAVGFAFWCIPQLLFYGLYALWGQVLNAREQFGWFMWAPAANSVVAIAGLVAYLALFGGVAHEGASASAIVADWNVTKTVLLAGVATLGIAAQAFILIPPMVRGGYRWRWVWRGPKGELSSTARVASWSLGAVLVEQVGLWLVTRVQTAAPLAAAQLAHPSVPVNQLVPEPGVAGNAAYVAALGIYLVPHSLISISLMTALFTQMSRHAAAGDLGKLRAVLSEGVRLVTAFTMIASAVLFVAAPHVVRVLVPTVDGASVDAVAWVLRLMVIGLVPLGASVMAKQAFFALEDGRTVFLIHVAMSAAWLAVAYGVKWTLAPEWWVVGAALGLTVTNLVAFVFRMLALRGRLDGVDGRRVLVTLAKTLAAAIIAAVPGAAIVWWAPQTYLQNGWGAVAGSVGIAVAVGLVMLATYALAVRLLKLPEAADAARALARRMGRVR